MAERLTPEDFEKRLATELARESELVSLVVRSKGTPVRKEVFRIWGDEKLLLETPVMRVVATGGIVGIAVVIAAIMTSRTPKGG